MAKFTPHTEEQVNEMLKIAGVDSIDNLFKDIPQNLRPESFNIPRGETEFEVLKSLRNLAGSNKTYHVSFLGGGYYDHYIPSAVGAISGRSEFYTAYTPYQPEASQGWILQMLRFTTEGQLFTRQLQWQ